MGLLSFLKRDAATPTSGAATGRKSGASRPDEVQSLRLRARRRLIGAAVLVAAGVVVFPLVFETQPRPIPVDLPIEIPRKEAVAPLVVPSADPAPLAPPGTPAPAASIAAAAAQATERARDVIEEAAPAAAVALPADKPTQLAVEKPVEKPADKTPKPAKPAASVSSAGSSAAAARAQALLEGREPPARASAPAANRYIVQVGAFAENKAAQDVRLKVEKLGLKTYAQAVETAEGKRVRVRLGPFASREDADRSLAKLRAAGLAGTVLTL